LGTNKNGGVNSIMKNITCSASGINSALGSNRPEINLHISDKLASRFLSYFRTSQNIARKMTEMRNDEYK
jgi:hypothetical protein